MWMVIVALLAGFLMGHFNVLSEKIRGYVSNVITFCLIMLLLLIGAKIGLDREMIHHLSTLGIQSFLLAFSTIVFSLISLYILVKILGWEDETKMMGKGGESDDMGHYC